ncbi:MAG: Integral rane protein TerC [Gammaproteobacteria bacterium]|nr:Integral rane protein TerC [Gammaproteobacteria bacterium]
MDFLTNYGIWASFFSLTALEIVLNVDNVVFIALVVAHLPLKQRNKARAIGLGLALLFRIAMLLGIVWIMSLTKPWIHLFDFDFSGKDLMMLGGGLFLIYKATQGIHDDVTDDQKITYKKFRGGFISTIIQIVIIDLIFSFDSIMTAVGITHYVPVIVAAMTVAIAVMFVSSNTVSKFIMEYPTLKMLALAFVLLIGVFLVAEGFGWEVPKGYIYFAMAFSLGVEILNIIVRKKHTKHPRQAAKKSS